MVAGLQWPSHHGRRQNCRRLPRWPRLLGGPFSSLNLFSCESPFLPFGSRGTGDAQRALTSPGNLLIICASHMVVPIHERLCSAKTACSLRNAQGSVQMARIFLSCVQQLKCLCEAEWGMFSSQMTPGRNLCSAFSTRSELLWDGLQHHCPGDHE